MTEYDALLLQAIRSGVRDQIAAVRAENASVTTDASAFAFWYLTEFEELSEEEALECMTDGPWDEGRDAVRLDEESRTLTIYQFKYSESAGYVIDAFTDVQRGLIAESAAILSRAGDGEFLVQGVRSVVVSMTFQDSGLEGERQRVQGDAIAWLADAGRSDVDYQLTHDDALRFAQAVGKIVGVDLRLKFAQAPLALEGGFLGLVDARGLKSYINSDELVALNIRRFLGLGGTVNKKINKSMSNSMDRAQFWKLNNGLVCVATRATPLHDDEIEFANFAIVNGAQTSSVVCKYMEKHPLVDEPLWLVAKILLLESDDRTPALRFTVSSNTQNSAGDSDIRGAEVIHEYLARWIRAFTEQQYVFKKGVGRPPRDSVRMLDLAQAYVAWSGYPDVSFSRKGQIFKFDNEPDYYALVFPEDQIVRLELQGDPAAKDEFLAPRLLAWKTLMLVRSMLTHMIKDEGIDKKWNSLAYHLVWMYGQVFAALADDDARFSNPRLLLPQADIVVGGTCARVFDSVYDQVNNVNAAVPEPDQYVIPKDLKSTRFLTKFLEAGYMRSRGYQDVRQQIAAALPH